MDKDYQNKRKGVIHRENFAVFVGMKKLGNKTALKARQENYLKLIILQLLTVTERGRMIEGVERGRIWQRITGSFDSRLYPGVVGGQRPLEVHTHWL